MVESINGADHGDDEEKIVEFPAPGRSRFELPDMPLCGPDGRPLKEPEPTDEQIKVDVLNLTVGQLLKMSTTAGGHFVIRISKPTDKDTDPISACIAVTVGTMAPYMDAVTTAIHSAKSRYGLQFSDEHKDKD